MVKRLKNNKIKWNEEINKLKDKLNISFYGEKAKEQQDKMKWRNK